MNTIHSQRSSSTPRQLLHRWLWMGFLSTALIGILTMVAIAAIVRNPDLLKPLIQAGVPLDLAGNVPILGDAIHTAQAPQMSVQELKQLIDDQATDYVLVDVRRDDEYAIAKIPGAIHIPVTEIEDGSAIPKLKSTLQGRHLITYCHSGKRSNKALAVLRKEGIVGVNVQGGIKAWQQEIDPSLPAVF